MSNCTIISNVSGGIYAIRGASITNSIIRANEPQQLYGVDCADVSYSSLQYGTCSNINGNISDDPLFVPGPLGDYYLSQITAGQFVDSPCLDAGNDSATTLEVDQFSTRTDHAGDIGLVDMGYHYPRTDALGDINYDGIVDRRDVAWIAHQCERTR